MCEVVERFKKEGYEQGEKHGYERGDKHGYEQGEKHGYERGDKHGYERAKQEDKQEYIKIAAKLRDEGMPEEKIRKILGDNYDKNIS